MFFDSTSPWRNRVSSARVSSPGRGARRSRLRLLRRPTRGLLGIDHLIEQLENRSLLTSLTVGPNINITKSAANEAETTIALNPTNANNLFAIDTKTYQGRNSTDGGLTWTLSNMAGFTTGNGNDVQAVWDSFGNLFVTRLGAGGVVEVGISSNGGASFSSVQTIAGSGGTDQPTLAVGPSGVAGTPGAVWVSYELGGNILASGAAVNGLGLVGAFNAPETAPGSTNGDFGSVSIGPAGQVLVNYQDGLSGGAAGGEGPGTISTNLDPDGLGPAGFNASITAHSTNVGGTASIPPQPGPFNVGGRTIDSEANLAYDDSGGVHNGRVYMVYTDRTSVPPPANNNTDIFVIFSDNNGTNWSAPVRVNDDPSAGTVGATQYLPAIAVDQTTGYDAVSWYDTRNSPTGTTRDTYASASVDGGATWLPNVRLSAALSNPLSPAVGTFNSGDLDLMTFANDVFYRSWSDNSNSTGDNPAGAGNAFDIYTARVTVSTPPTVTPPANQTSVEGASQLFNLGSFTDPDGGPWTVDVSWGDSTPDTVFTATAPGTITPQNHTYGEEGTKTGTITVTDNLDGQSDSKGFTVAVSDPAVVQGPAVPVSAVEGAGFTGTAFATFTDPGGAEPNPSDPTGTHYTVVSIDWGDSTPLDTTSGAISFSGSPGSKTDPFTVSGNHTYGEEGTYTIKAIIDHEGVPTTVTSTAMVSDPKVLASGVPVFAVECKPLSGVTLATFTDPGGAEPNPSDPIDGIASHYKVVSIDWGDSTPLDTLSGSISFGGAQGSKTDPFTVSGTHTYATEGTHTITAIIDHEGVTTTVTTTVTINDQLGLLLLDPSGSQSLMVTGNGDVTVTGTGNCGAVVVDSNDATKAAFVTGNGVVAAGDFDVTGGVFTAGHGVVPGPVDHEAPTPDPLLGLALPSPLPPAPVGNTATVLNPGTYVGGLHFSDKTAVTLEPGVYVMEGGGFSVTGQASVTGSGVVLINIPGGPSDTISVSGKGVLSLSAPGIGQPFQGVAVFQASSNPVSFSGQAKVTIAGAVYTPTAPVSITGQAVVTINSGAGTATLPSIFAAMIAYDLQASGNGVLTINADPPNSSSADVHSLALDALVSGGGLSSSSTLTDQEAMNEVAMSLAGTTDLGNGFFNHTKKKG